MMRELGIQSVIRKKRKYFGVRGSIVYENLLARNFVSSQPKQKLATDITYINTTDGFIYLSVVQDLFNNEIITYKISAKNDMDLVLSTIQDLPLMPGAILHSDQGFQYTHKKYKEELEVRLLKGSHSRKGNCLDNACVESFFSQLKTECFWEKRQVSKDEASSLIQNHITFYNEKRLQKKLGQLSPVEYRKKLAA